MTTSTSNLSDSLYTTRDDVKCYSDFELLSNLRKYTRQPPKHLVPPAPVSVPCLKDSFKGCIKKHDAQLNMTTTSSFTDPLLYNQECRLTERCKPLAAAWSASSLPATEVDPAPTKCSLASCVVCPTKCKSVASCVIAIMLTQILVVGVMNNFSTAQSLGIELVSATYAGAVGVGSDLYGCVTGCVGSVAATLFAYVYDMLPTMCGVVTINFDCA